MKVSKNIKQGSEIKDLKILLELALKAQSVVVKTNHGWFYVRPAAWIVNWPLREILKCTFYQSVKIKHDPKNR